MPADFASLPMEDQQRILTMGLQQFRSGAPANKQNMNRMREILVSDPAYAKQLMTDAGIGGYSNGGDESGWVAPVQNAYSPDEFLAEDGTDAANAPTPLQGAQQAPSALGQQSAAVSPPVRPGNLNGEQAIAEEGAAGGAVDPSSDWGTILAQMLGVGGAGAGIAYGLSRLNRKSMSGNADSSTPMSGSTDITPKTMPPGTDGRGMVPDRGAAIPATRAATAVGPVRQRFDDTMTEADWRYVNPTQQVEGQDTRQLPAPNVEQSIDASMEDSPNSLAPPPRQVTDQRPVENRDAVQRVGDSPITAETTPETQSKVARVRSLLQRYDLPSTSARQKQTIEQSIRELGYKSAKEARQTAGVDTPRVRVPASNTPTRTPRKPRNPL